MYLWGLPNLQPIWHLNCCIYLKGPPDVSNLTDSLSWTQQIDLTSALLPFAVDEESGLLLQHAHEYSWIKDAKDRARTTDAYHLFNHTAAKFQSMSPHRNFANCKMSININSWQKTAMNVIWCKFATVTRECLRIIWFRFAWPRHGKISNVRTQKAPWKAYLAQLLPHLLADASAKSGIATCPAQRMQTISLTTGRHLPPWSSSKNFKLIKKHQIHPKRRLWVMTQFCLYFTKTRS